MPYLILTDCTGLINLENDLRRKRQPKTRATMTRMYYGAPGELFLLWARPIIITVSLNVMLGLLEMGKLSPGHSKFIDSPVCWS